jgi:ABC-type oligopeptide transport system substrate-binding subunit
VKDYWGASLPSQVGQNNFDELRFEFFRDNLVALEAFKADQADWIAENSAKQWATAYDFPAVTEKRVLKEEFPINDSGRMQAFVLNLRRDQFKDARLRRAFNYASTEEMNKQLSSASTSASIATSRVPNWLVPACRKGRNCKFWKLCATRCRPNYSPRLMSIRSAAIPRRCAPTCGRPRSC